MKNQGPRLVGSMYIMPLTEEQSELIRKATDVKKSYPYGGSGIYSFVVPLDIVKNLSANQVMNCCGYSPYGYGSAFDETRSDTHMMFNCWGSCD